MLPKRRFSLPALWSAALAAVLLWALAAGSLTWWWLHWPRGPANLTPSSGLSAGPVRGQTQAGVARALGHYTNTTPAPEEQKRFVLHGVIASRSGQGSALLAVDGQLPAAFVQGQTVVEGWRLQSVRETGVRLQGNHDAPPLDLQLAVRP